MVSWNRRAVALAAALLLLAAACTPASPAPASPTLAVGTPAGAITPVDVPTATAPEPPNTPDPAASPLAQTAPSATLPPPSPTACLETAGHFEPVDVPSPTLGYPIHSLIYTPPCYAATRQSYPVLYLIHGLNYNEDQWERLGVGTEADKLIAAGQIAPLIIVLPRDTGDLLLDPAFVNDLVPYVDGHYRTLASAGYRAIGGMSRGGGWAIHLGLHYPNIFGRIGAHSPAIFYGDETNVLKYLRAVDKTSTIPAIYIDIGASDPTPQSAVWLDQMLTALRIPHTYLTPPGDHSERYWSAHVDDYLRFYAAVWLPQPPATPTTPTATATARPSPTHPAH